MPQLQQYVSNAELVVAKNLRFNDSAGIPVTSMLPIGMNGTVVADSPTTGYISRIGAILSDQIDAYSVVSGILATYGTDITTLQSQVAALQISGTTIPSINGLCYTGNTNALITTLLGYTITDLCAYKPVLGTTTALTEAILAEGIATLNAAPAFSQHSAMAGLSGWISDPVTIADTVNNSWLAYNDARTGITTALAAVTPSCAQAIIDYQAVYNSSLSGFNIYFSGYSFIPTGFSDSGSIIDITDGRGGILQVAINVVSRSLNPDPLFLAISGSTLTPGLSSYTATLNSSLSNSSLGLSCDRTTIKAVLIGGTSGGSSAVTGFYSNAISGTTTSIVIISSLEATPSAVTIVPKNAYTGALLVAHPYYLTYTASGAVLTFTTATASDTGTFNIDWIAYLTG